jgi:hypothetical protein
MSAEFKGPQNVIFGSPNSSFPSNVSVEERCFPHSALAEFILGEFIMGFWHTGYFEFHEPVGLEGEWKPTPPQVRCSVCGINFDSEDDLRQHRFEVHPLSRPTIFLDGREIGNQRVTITRPMRSGQLVIKGAERAFLNDREVALAALGRSVAQFSDDVCRIVLLKNGVPAHLEIEIRIATEVDLKGIEAQFERMAATRRLDSRVVEEFIAACSPFKTAVGYCDGICNYLYGLMAKERATDCSLRHEQYIEKYSAAAERLAPYDRGLSRTVGGLIEFHFNHFQDAVRLCPDSRLGYVSNYFATWVASRTVADSSTADTANRRATSIEKVVTELDTERILTWASLPLKSLAVHLHNLEEMCRRMDLAEFDRVKLHMLLGESLAATGNTVGALVHARSLRNLPTVEAWAESLISKIGDNS